jgi:hypothetical protein
MAKYSLAVARRQDFAAATKGVSTMLYLIFPDARTEQKMDDEDPNVIHGCGKSPTSYLDLLNFCIGSTTVLAFHFVALECSLSCSSKSFSISLSIISISVLSSFNALGQCLDLSTRWLGNWLLLYGAARGISEDDRNCSSSAL